MLTLRALVATSLGLTLAAGLGRAAPVVHPITRKIASTGQSLPVIGMGSYGTYDVESGSDEIDRLTEMAPIFAAL